MARQGVWCTPGRTVWDVNIRQSLYKIENEYDNHYRLYFYRTVMFLVAFV